MQLRRRSILSLAIRLFLPAIILFSGAFLLSGCKVAVLDRVTFICDATGMASATFQWAPIGREDGTQYLDLSPDNSFPGGLFVGAGPFSSDRQSYSWNGLPAGETSYWRVNTLINGAWYTSATGTLTTPCVQERSQYLLAKGINGMRSANGLPPLTLDSGLTTIANGRARDMANNDYFSHYPPDGCNLGCLLQKAGVEIMDWGEIIARNNYFGVDEEVSVALDGWRNSPGHFAIITDKSYRSLGVGFALDATGTSYEVGVFEEEETAPTSAATPAKSPTPNATPTPTPASTSSGN